MSDEIIGQIIIGIATIVGAGLAARVGSNKNIITKQNELEESFKTVVEGKQYEHENKQLHQKIKANLIGSARIKWIQEVRNESTNLINNLNTLSGADDIKLLIDYNHMDNEMKHLAVIDASLYRLLLYFGEDTFPAKESQFEERTTNQGFNYVLIEHIEILLKQIDDRRTLLMEIYKKDSMFTAKIEMTINKSSANNQTMKNITTLLAGIEESLDGTVFDSLNKEMASVAKSVKELQDWSKIVDEKDNNKDKKIEELFYELINQGNVFKFNDRKTRETTKKFTDMMRDYLKKEWKQVQNELE